MLSRLKAALQPFGAYRAARFAWHFARDPVFRRDHLLLWRRPKNLFQHRSITAPNRQPVLFAFVRDRLAAEATPRVLSFGCAMGDEVFSLRHHLPRAAVKGLDINPANIATARARLAALGSPPGLCFEVSDSAAGEPAGHYDAVFCLAVFVRWALKENRAVTTCVPHLHFADFARATADLAAAVKPGGYLVIRHAMFRFADTPAARGFSPVLVLPEPGEFFPRFGPDDRRLADDPDEAVVFRKHPDAVSRS